MTTNPPRDADIDALAEWLCVRYGSGTSYAWESRNHAGKRPWRQDALDLRNSGLLSPSPPSGGAPKEGPDQWSELERLAKAATPGKRRAMREGNQYIETSYVPTAKLVGASRVEGLVRPWNPHAAIVHGLKAADHEVVRLKDEDADFVAACDPESILTLISQARACAAQPPAPLSAQPGDTTVGTLLAALDAAESILRYMPYTATNCGGTKPNMDTATALKLVRAALASHGESINAG